MSLTRNSSPPATVDRKEQLLILSLAAIWIVLHILPVSRVEIWSQWEIWQARKLLEYGFVERAGGLLEPGYDTGRLAFPSEINYTHHPHLMVWLYTLIYAIGGPWLCFVYLLALRLVATLVLYRLLCRFFSRKSSWWATVLYIMAPAAMVMDVETNIIAIAAAYWPFAAWLAIRVHETGKGYAALGMFVFFGGQTSWLFLTLMLPLIWLAAPQGVSWKQLIRHPFRLPSTRAVLIGGGLALAVFLLQIVWYTADFGDLLHYLRAQMGLVPMTSSEVTPKWKMATAVLLRTSLYLGPALCIGALIGAAAKENRMLRIVQAALLFIGAYIFVEFALLRFCFVEASPYVYLLTPLAVLTAAALDAVRSTRFIACLVGASILAFGYFSAREAIPKRAKAVAILAAVFESNTQPDNIVLTNLKEYHPPFAAWDNSGGALVRADSDRLIYFNIHDAPAVDWYRRQLKRNFRNVIFAISPESPMDSALREWVETTGQSYSSQSVMIPREPAGLAIRIRLAIWAMTGRFTDRSASDDDSPYRASLTFYRMPF